MQSINVLGCQGDAYGVLWHHIPFEHTSHIDGSVLCTLSFTQTKNIPHEVWFRSLPVEYTIYHTHIKWVSHTATSGLIGQQIVPDQQSTLYPTENVPCPNPWYKSCFNTWDTNHLFRRQIIVQLGNDATKVIWQNIEYLLWFNTLVWKGPVSPWISTKYIFNNKYINSHTNM